MKTLTFPWRCTELGDEMLYYAFAVPARLLGHYFEDASKRQHLNINRCLKMDKILNNVLPWFLITEYIIIAVYRFIGFYFSTTFTFFSLLKCAYNEMVMGP